MNRTARPAIFLDRDGVINANRVDHVKSWVEFTFLPGTLWALRRLAQLAWPIIVISNQAAVGRGLVTYETVDDIHRRMQKMVEKTGGRIDSVLYCPHKPEDGCECRKPNPGLLLRASQEMNLDLTHSFLVGDAMTDMTAARAVGAHPILVKTGRGQEQLSHFGDSLFSGIHVADDLNEAAIWIIAQVEGSLSTQSYPGWQEAETMQHQIAVNE